MIRAGSERGPGGLAEVELVRRARGGDVIAFGQLVERYQRTVWRFLATWVPDPADREEIVQEVFLAAHRGIQRFRGEAAFSTWLLQIAVNQARGRRRRWARRPRHVELPERGVGEEALDERATRLLGGARRASVRPDELAVESELRLRVWELVDRLPDDWRAAMRLRYLEEMTHPEIAEVLGTPVGTIKAQLHRARQRLVELLREEEIE